MPPRGLPSFFKILLERSAPHMPLPAGFFRKHLENKIPENPILLSVNGGHSWRLKIKKDGEIYSFTDGWNDVVEDSQLGFGDFLVFWLVDESTFKLSIFSPNGCEKNFPPKILDEVEEEEEVVVVKEEEEEMEEDDDDDDDEDEEAEEDDDEEEDIESDDEDEEEEEDGDNYDDDGGVDEEEEGDVSDEDDNGGDVDGDDGDPFFMAIMSTGHTRSMRLPSKFTLLAGIDTERSVIMKDIDGNEFEMSLRLDGKCYTDNYNKRYCLSIGWTQFWRANELSIGDICVFKYIKSEDKFCLAKVTKKRGHAKLPVGKALASQPPRVVVESKDNASEVPAGEVLKRKSRREPPHVAVESKDDGKKAVKKNVRAKPPAEKVPVAEVLNRLRGRPPRVEVVEKKVPSRRASGKAPAVEVSKRPRGRPPRVEVVEKMVRSKSKKPAGKVPVVELKRPRGRPPRVEVVEKKVASERKRGRPVVVESKGKGEKVVGRSRGRPFKRKRGRPAGNVK